MAPSFAAWSLIPRLAQAGEPGSPLLATPRVERHGN